ncbi:PRD domain-containing protein [Williamsia sp. CHRR-6]|uniref:PRD domain-containing protein n=1 Tax=Williamsia sp. CHRR-6 TaxID=2835871 RepID=UPI001BD9C23A|nr:PRD domain-containing protein [Williamsia sp. CHRR-6]MBT0565873.1 PRD domain-containing protein [Williamsia sp. CHRR-6]
MTGVTGGVPARILRVFNNNVVLARDPDRGEVILTGRGVGFAARPGDLIDAEKITKVFVPEHGRDPDTVAAMVAAIPADVIELTTQALSTARLDSVPASTVIAIADHLAVAMRRRRELDEHEPAHPLQAEVAHLYPAELDVARRVVAAVNTAADFDLPDDEATSVALHLVNSGFTGGDLTLTYRMTGLFTQLLDMLEQLVGWPIARDSIDAARFITHMRYFVVRAHTDRQLDRGMSAAAEAIRTSLPEAYQAATRLQSLLELRLSITMTDDEVTYLALHVARLTRA